MVTQEEYDAATKLAASGENTGIKALPQDKQLKLYGWFKQVKEGDNTTAAPGICLTDRRFATASLGQGG